MSAVPDRYRDHDQDDALLLVLADALDPPPAEETATDSESWRQAVAVAQAALARESG
jgi:hypothetical protein